MVTTPAQLILESGETFDGQSSSQLHDMHFGEVVFNTGMTGYVESLTDPSYSGQILVFTYPLIGNYGVSSSTDWESKKIHVKGIVVSELASFYSSHSAQFSLQQWLDQQHIPYLVGADTRAITKVLRDKGVIPGAIAPLNKKPDHFEAFAKINWVEHVSIKEPILYGTGEKLIIVIDCGIKENILRSLQEFPVRLKRVPHDYDFSEEAFDGIFISNGPGDPIHCQSTIRIIQKALTKQKPTFGICLGTQLMALAVGASTYKLPFGHRSHNQPCLQIGTERSYLTSQNHSYAVDETTLPADWQVAFRNLNDQSVEGIEHKTLPFFSVQFHPEAAPGPMDTTWLFKKFYDLVQKA